MKSLRSITESIRELNASQALEAVTNRVDRGDDPHSILLECRQGLEEVGKRFEKGDYFIAELLFGANIFKKIMETLEPELRKRMSIGTLGKVVIATVKNDIHDIGKNLVALMLNAAGFEVIDLGINVPSDEICKRIQKDGPDIVALSCLLTSTMDSVEETIVDMDKRGLRSNVKVIIGGNPLSPEIALAMGADGYGRDAYEAVIKCKELLQRKDR